MALVASHLNTGLQKLSPWRKICVRAYQVLCTTLWCWCKLRLVSLPHRIDLHGVQRYNSSETGFVVQYAWPYWFKTVNDINFQNIFNDIGCSMFCWNCHRPNRKMFSSNQDIKSPWYCFRISFSNVNWPNAKYKRGVDIRRCSVSRDRLKSLKEDKDFELNIDILKRCWSSKILSIWSIS